MEGAADALQWRDRYNIRPASRDVRTVLLLLIDLQNTFCLPGFELFVASRSGHAAVDDNDRLCRFIYHH